MNNKYFKKRIEGEDEIFHIKTPCRFLITEDVVKDLKGSYKPNEEIGGILWVKPEDGESEKIIFKVEKVSYIRNAIEDNPREDKYTKRNAYRFDAQELEIVFQDVLKNSCLPIQFHSHPTHGKDFFTEFINFSSQLETSKQDRIEAEQFSIIQGKKVLMPRALIVGNDIIQGNIFIGLYHGFIAPHEFEVTKKEVQQENIRKTVDTISKIKISFNHKIAIVVGAILLLIVIVKYKKYSIPVIASLLVAALSFLGQTSSEPKYFNRLSSGDAIIDIPEFEN